MAGPWHLEGANDGRAAAFVTSHDGLFPCRTRWQIIGHARLNHALKGVINRTITMKRSLETAINGATVNDPQIKRALRYHVDQSRDQPIVTTELACQKLSILHPGSQIKNRGARRRCKELIQPRTLAFA